MERTWKPTVSGLLAIISGVFTIIIGVVWGLLLAPIGALFPSLWFVGWFGAIGAPLIIFGIIAIIGGIYALQRKTWGLALAGSICALIGPGWVLGILAIIFVSLGKGEFE